MCYFITVAVPTNCAEEFVAIIPRGLAVAPYKNPSVTKHIPIDFRLLVLTSGMCSCDLFTERVGVQRFGQHAERLRKKYTRLHWSEAKIERSIESSIAAQKDQPSQEGYDDRVRKLVADFAEEVRDDVKLIVHFYRGDVNNERFNVKQGAIISPSAFRDGDCDIGEDELVTISTKRRHRM